MALKRPDNEGFLLIVVATLLALMATACSPGPVEEHKTFWGETDRQHAEKVERRTYMFANLRRLTPGPTWRSHYEEVQACVASIMGDSVTYNDPEFDEIRHFQYTEGWVLDPKTHEGTHAAGAMLGRRNILLDDEYIDNVETLRHEYVHVVVPKLMHRPPFDKIEEDCVPDFISPLDN